MKKFLLILAVSTIFLGIGWAVVEQVLHVNQFGGMMNDIDPLALPDGVAADSENVITDLGNGIQPREGYISYSTEPSKALWVFAKSNGTRYLITHSGNSLKADSGNKTFAVTISTVAPSIVTAGSQLGDYFYFCNTVDGLKRWDGTTVSVASATMTMNQLVTWKGRLVGAGKPGAERTLFISRYLDGTAWTLAIDPSDDDPAQITVGGSLDENITGLYASYKDLLIWFKNTSFGGLFGSRRSNFALRTFSESVGTNHPGTVRDCDGLLRFLGPRRTVWEFDGSNLTKISEGNNELFDTIINGESNSRTATITNQADYEAGTNAGLNTTSTPGSIILSTWTKTDTTGSDFASGTLTNLTTTTVSGELYFSPNNSDLSLSILEPISLTSGWQRTNSQHKSGTYSAGFNPATFPCAAPSTTDSIQMILANGGTAVYTSANRKPGTASVWTQSSETLSSFAGKYLTLVIRTGGTCSGGSSYLSDWAYGDIYLSGQPITWWLYQERIGGAGGRDYLYVDLFEGGVNTNTTADIVSQTFDTGFSSPSWLIGNANWTMNGNSITGQTQTSNDGSSWDSLLSWTSGSKPASSNKRYFRYKISLAMQSGTTTGYPYISDVTFSARQASGTFVSYSQFIGSSISSWNVFQRDETLNNGTITYGFYTDTDTTKTIGGDGLPVVGTFTSSQTITNNTIPSISTAPYAFFSAKFNITASTQNPTNDRMSITWDEGSSLKAKSVWTKQRYWLSTSRASTAYNDTIFVYDRQKQWQRYTGLNALDIQLHNSYPMIGSASGISQGETGTSDAGSSISSSYTTKYFFPNGSETRAYLRDLWMTTTNSDATLGTSIYYDGTATPITLGSFAMNGQEGYQVKKLPIPISGIQAVRHAAIRWDVTGTERWKILNGSLYFDPDTQRE